MMSSPFSGSHNVLPLWLRGSTLQTQTHTHAHTDTGDRWTNGEMCAHWREREKKEEKNAFKCESLELCLLVIVSMM